MKLEVVGPDILRGGQCSAFLVPAAPGSLFDIML